MSTILETADTSCASCGIAEADEIKLKTSIIVSKIIAQHEATCKERAAELRDEILFRQPESTHVGDCPICCLPLPIEIVCCKSKLQTCCSKVICKGCFYANDLRQIEQSLDPTEEEENKMILKRVEANDPVAIAQVGREHCAVELGDVNARYNLSLLYRKGGGVEKHMEKELYHLEEAAIAGQPHARYDLGIFEGAEGRFDRMVKHFIISANLGHDESIQELKKCYVRGFVSKEDFAGALRAHQSAVDATKSPQREEAAKFDAE
ncbi:hypothetical protein QTG54_005573 [Skeletonema marinoi]|uniref:RING-type domain-containing protein n=1 Tax=Skeletonema marinoi TaxID=267567 RepID=A0AAD8YCM6_9STRA|nr:hypothetical protein QTG54_005573 [Skeletonema marinoi]